MILLYSVIRGWEEGGLLMSCSHFGSQHWVVCVVAMLHETGWIGWFLDFKVQWIGAVLSCRVKWDGVLMHFCQFVPEQGGVMMCCCHVV